MTATLHLCGAGNSEGVRLALTINRDEARWDRIVLLDDDLALHGRRLLGVEVIGGLGLLAEADPRTSEVANLIARTTAKRRAAREKIRPYGLPFATLVHPRVAVEGAELPRDLLVYESAIVSPEVSIGEGSVVFMGAVVGHESRVGALCVLAAGSVLNARVTLADEVYVGTNAAVLPEVRVGEGATIGACSAVIRDVPAGATAIGVPAEVIVRSVAPRREDPPHEDPPREDLRRPEERLANEAAIREVWSAVLGHTRIDATDNFFDVGGTSLLALHARALIQEALGIELSTTDLFRYPTVRALAGRVASMGEAPGDALDDVRSIARRRAVRQVRRRDG